MISFPIHRVVLEGCDTSGKTTLYREIHKRSGFRWNIHDRSFLSMLVYARLYGRVQDSHVRGLWEELTNLNNSFLLCLPSWDVVRRRLAERGDDVHDETSLLRTYDLFAELQWLGQLSNVRVLDTDAVVEDLSDDVTGWLKSREDVGLAEISSGVRRFLQGLHGQMDKPDIAFRFEFLDDGNFEEYDPDIYDDPDEGSYFTEIRGNLFAKIEREMQGLNEHNEPQSWLTTRRLIYTSDTCISLIHLLVRKGRMETRIVIRSSNVEKTLPKDLQFLYNLPHEVQRAFQTQGCPQLPVRYLVSINSGHLVR